MVRKRSRIRVPSWAPFRLNVHYIPHGEVPEWLKGADCKSAGYGLRGFESLSHQSFFPLDARVQGLSSPARRSGPGADAPLAAKRGFTPFSARRSGPVSRSTLWSRGCRRSCRHILTPHSPRGGGRNLFQYPENVVRSGVPLTALAQLVEQRIPNPQVGGSIPSGRALLFPFGI